QLRGRAFGLTQPRFTLGEPAVHFPPHTCRSSSATPGRRAQGTVCLSGSGPWRSPTRVGLFDYRTRLVWCTLRAKLSFVDNKRLIFTQDTAWRLSVNNLVKQVAAGRFGVH